MRILVTGATGFIGSHLVRRLLTIGHDVVCLARVSSDTCLLESVGSKVVTGDVTLPETIKAAIKGCDIVHHLAIDVYRSSVSETLEVARIAVNAGVHQFVYYSSIAAVGLRNRQLPITEQTPCRPDTAYGQLKYVTEQVLMQKHRQDGWPVSIVRPTLVYGPGDFNWLPLFRSVYEGRFRFFGNGRNQLPLCYIDDFIDAVIRMQDNLHLGEIFIVAGPEMPSLRDVVGSIARSCNRLPPGGTMPTMIGEWAARVWQLGARLKLVDPIAPFLLTQIKNRWSLNLPCDIRKAREILGYKPRIGLVEGVERTLAWYLTYGYLGNAPGFDNTFHRIQY